MRRRRRLLTPFALRTMRRVPVKGVDWAGCVVARGAELGTAEGLGDS